MAILKLNWSLIFSNAISGAITGSFTAVAVYLSMKAVTRAERISMKAAEKTKNVSGNDEKRN
jgi:cytidylate kinase